MAQGQEDEKVVPWPHQVAAGGGGPHDPGMETRVGRLEVHIEHIQGDINEIKSDIREINETRGPIFACFSAR